MTLDLDWQELKDYIEEELGGEFDRSKMQGLCALLEKEFATYDSSADFYRRSLLYLYHLTAFDRDQWIRPYFEAIQEQVRPCDVLDYGCRIGANGLRLARRGFVPSFADFDGECVRFLRWRLEQRGMDWPVYDIEKDDIPRHSFLLSIGVVSRTPSDEQWELILRMAELGQWVAFNLPYGDPRTALHYPVDALGLVKRIRETFNLFYHRVFNDFQHFVIFDTTEWYSTTLAVYPGLTDWVSTPSADFEEAEENGCI